MRKNITLIAVFMLLISMVFISCAPEKAVDDGDTFEAYFGYLDAKAVNDTAYNVSGSSSISDSTVTIESVDKYYWSYKATKKDSLFTQGQTNGFVNCAEGTGLGSSRTFSKGKWLFELRAYASAADRTAGTQYLFSGTNESSANGVQPDDVISENCSIAIPVTYSYIAGTGTANFTVTTTLTQNTENGGSDITSTTYKVTKVEAIIGSDTVSLTGDTNKTKWTGSKAVSSGYKDVSLKVYIADETTTRSAITNSSSKAIILHGLTTKITGSATITLNGATISLGFSSTLPTAQPEGAKVK